MYKFYQSSIVTAIYMYCCEQSEQEVVTSTVAFWSVDNNQEL